MMKGLRPTHTFTNLLRARCGRIQRVFATASRRPEDDVDGAMSRRSNKRNQRGASQPANRSATPPNQPVSRPADAGATSDVQPAAAVKPQRAARPAGRRKRKQPNWIIIAAAIGGLALLGVFIMNLSRQLMVVEGVQSYGPFAANIHVTGDVNYPQTPPTGGEHFASWMNCGIYNRPVQDELAVHSMEHGAVWITYRPDLPADDVERLKNLVRGRSYTLLSPYENLPAPVVASAWGVQLVADGAADPRLEQFVTKYRQGAQTPEPGAACVGGQGAPDER